MIWRLKVRLYHGIFVFYYRVGGKEKFFHCDKCGICLAVCLQGKHKVRFIGYSAVKLYIMALSMISQYCFSPLTPQPKSCTPKRYLTFYRYIPQKYSFLLKMPQNILDQNFESPNNGQAYVYWVYRKQSTNSPVCSHKHVWVTSPKPVNIQSTLVNPAMHKPLLSH